MAVAFSSGMWQILLLKLLAFIKNDSEGIIDKVCGIASGIASACDGLCF